MVENGNSIELMDERLAIFDSRVASLVLDSELCGYVYFRALAYGPN